MEMVQSSPGRASEPHSCIAKPCSTRSWVSRGVCGVLCGLGWVSMGQQSGNHPNIPFRPRRRRGNAPRLPPFRFVEPRRPERLRMCGGTRHRNPHEPTRTRRNSQELAGTRRNSQKLAETRRNSQKLAETRRNSQELAGTRRNPEKLGGARRRWHAASQSNMHFSCTPRTVSAPK